MYVLGAKLLIKTDHESLKYLLDQRITTTNQQKWITKLLGLDYDIVYKRGEDNVATDAFLSRQFESRAQGSGVFESTMSSHAITAVARLGNGFLGSRC